MELRKKPLNINLRIQKAFLLMLCIALSGFIKAQSPGGNSTNLTFWYKANEGTSTTTNGAVITAWNDQTANGINASELTAGPSYQGASANFNPLVDFSTTSGGLIVPDNASINTSSSTAKSYTIVFKTGSDVTTQQLIYEQGGGGSGMNLYIDGGSLFVNLYNNSVEFSGSASISGSTNYIFTYVFDGANTRIDGYLNGNQVINNVTAPASLNTHGGDPGMGIVNGNTQYVGDIGSSNDEPFQGQVMEMAYYHNDAFITDERTRVESYMAVKYGISMTADYTASDGLTSIWDFSGNSPFSSNITGIGRDDDSDLNQKQSQSQSSDGLVIMGLGSIETDNVSNANTFSADKSFITWGSNGGSLAFTNTGAPAGSIILTRQWKIQEAGTVGNVRLRIPSNSSSSVNKVPDASSLQLLIDADGDFTSGSSATTMVLVGDNWETTVDFNDGDFFAVSVEGAALSTTTNGDETGPIDMVFTVTLPSINNTGSAITFDIADAGTGNASSGQDYTAIPGGAQISVADGQATGTYTIPVTDDALEEAEETVTVTISNPSNITITIGTASSTATITDNDAATPGGVTTDLVFWFKADAGTSTTIDGTLVTSWLDQTGNANDAFAVSTSPTYVSVLDNYKPALDYTSNTGGFTIEDDIDINTDGNGYTAKSFTVSFKTGTDITTRQVVYEQGGGGNGINLYIESGSLIANLFRSNVDYSSSTALNTNTSYVVSFTYDGNNSRCDMYLNGTLAGSVTNVNSLLPSHGREAGIGVIDNRTQFVGNVDVNDGESFLGYFMEIAYYNNTVFSTNERNRLETYLGLKYATSLGSDYLASDGSTVYWNATTNAGYLNDVAGIGLDEESGINIKQVKSTSDSTLLTVALGSIESTNDDNNNAFTSNKSFLVWGNNRGALSFTTTGAPPGDQILQRVWRVQETNTVGTVRIQIPDNSSSEIPKLPQVSSLNLVQDADGIFSSGATSTPMTLNGTNWEADVDFANGEYFSFTIGGANLSVTTNGDENGPVNIVYTATLLSTNTSGNAITFDINDAGTGTAISGSDYVAIASGSQITIPNNSISGDFTVVVNDDAFEEGTETLDVTISNPTPSSVSIGNATASATISDDDFSIPGNVSAGLVFWLKADKGVTTATEGSTVTAIVDQTFNGNDASQVSPGPTYDEVLTNFNPALDFSSVTGGLTIANDPEINSAENTEKSYSIVFRSGSDVNSRQLLFEEGGATNGMNVYIDAGFLVGNLWNGSVDNAASTAITINTDYIFTFVFDGANTRWDGYLNGDLVMTDATAPSSLLSHTGAVGIGVINNDTQYDGGIDVSTGEGFDGQIMEMIYYNNVAFDPSDRTRIESYLATKYGITYSNNYVASNNSTTFWSPSTNSTYQNDVAVIGRDGTSGLEQKQSQSANTDALVRLGLGNLSTSNVNNSGVFASNSEFLAWGNDDGSLVGVSDNSGLSPQSGVINQLQRTWRIEESGSVPTVQLGFPKTDVDGFFSSLFSYGGLSLRVADDATFTSNVQDVTLSTTNIDGADYYTANFDFSGTQYFTLVQTGFIIWDGTEWRGGLSAITDHGPSDEDGDTSKTLFILSGDTAFVGEGVSVTNVDIASSAILQMDPTSCLIVRGTIVNSGTLTFEADNTGFAQYSGPAINATFEQYIDTEGWHNIGSPFSDVNFTDFNFVNDNGQITHPLDGVSLDTCNYCNMWYYDPSTDIGTDIGFGATNAYGTWRSSTNSSQNFKADRGWNMYLDSSSNFSTAPWTVTLSGVFNSGNVSQIVNENNGGWNLIANPYPCNLDWDVVDDDIAAASIAIGYHVWDEENTNYATYSNSVGTLGATQYIPPFQGFYVQTATDGAQGSGDVFRNFSLNNNDKTTTCETSSFFKVESNPLDLIVLKTTNLRSKKIDETILRFDSDASLNFSPYEDSRKLLTSYPDVASIFSKADRKRLSINVLPYPLNSDNHLIGVISGGNHENQIELTAKPDGWIVYLEDLKTGMWHQLGELPYRFTQDNSFQERFLLHYSLSDFDIDFDADQPFSAFIKDGVLILEAEKSMLNNSWQLHSIEGSLLKNGTLSLTVKDQYSINTTNLKSGIYLLSVEYNGRLYTEKVPIIR